MYVYVYIYISMYTVCMGICAKLQQFASKTPARQRRQGGTHQLRLFGASTRAQHLLLPEHGAFWPQRHQVTSILQLHPTRRSICSLLLSPTTLPTFQQETCNPLPQSGGKWMRHRYRAQLELFLRKLCRAEASRAPDTSTRCILWILPACGWKVSLYSIGSTNVAKANMVEHP